LYRPGDPEDLKRAVTRAVTEYVVFRRSVAQARTQLSWESDAARLLSVYEAVGR